MKIIFAGTPDFAACALKALIDSEHEIVAVYTQPDRKAGRGQKLSASAVKQVALEHDLIIEQPKTLKDPEAQTQLQSYQADVMIVAAYGLLLPKAVLDMPKYGCINIHGSILPRWRGAAPVQRAILAGDSETGVTIMQMDEGLDTGDMLKIATLPISNTSTSLSLMQELATLGATTLIETLADLDNINAIKQDNDKASYAKKIDKAEGLIDWNNSAEAISQQVRAFNPWPGTTCEIEQQSYKIWNAIALDEKTETQPGQIIKQNKHGLFIATGNGTLHITELQKPGKKRQTF